MFKNRLLLLGVGLGLILGAVLLQLMLTVQEQDQSLNQPDPAVVQQELTLEQMKSRVEEEGYVLYDNKTAMFTQKQLDAAVNTAVAAAKAKQESIQPTSGDNKEDQPVQPAAAVQTKALYIPSGLDSSSVAAILVKLKVITDQKAFVDRMTIEHLNGKIQSSFFVFEGNPSLDEVIQTLTTSK